jgi:apolipoprotein N-acyltransferase
MIATALAALLSAAMFYVSQGLDGWWPMAWLAPVPLLWLAYGKTTTWQLLLASAIACFGGLIYGFQCYPTLPLPILLEVMVPEVVLFPVAVLFARWVQHRGGPAAALLAFPACWTVFEYLISLVSPHGTWGSLAYSQVAAPVLIQSASLFGLYGVTFLICLFASSVAMALRPSREALMLAGAGLAVCALNVIFGLLCLHAPQSRTLTVAAVVDESAVVAAYHEKTLTAAVNVSETYVRAIRGAASQGAQLAVTPEGGIFVDKAEWLSAVLAPLVAVSRQTGMQIIAGVYQRTPAGDLAFSIEPDGSVHSYAKRHLVPILEAEFTPGRGSGLLAAGRAVEICKDMDFQRTVRRDAAGGVRLMAVPAGDFVKDAWLHARMAILRGVENGFALVRAANQGLVTASDAQGRLTASKTVAASGTTLIVARVALGQGPTLYTRIGDAFPLACGVLVVLLGVLSLVRRRSDTGARSSLSLSPTHLP